jgi:hypothetical protein
MSDEHKELGKFTLHIEPEALRSVIASGRLLEFASKVAASAAAQVSAQLVERVSAAALQPDGLKAGATASVSFIFDGGDFGTRPPRPRWGVGVLGDLASPLKQLAPGETLG